MNEPSVFLLERMPWEKSWTIRLHLPHVHDGHAFAFDEEAYGCKTIEEAKELRDKIAAALKCKIMDDLPDQDPYYELLAEDYSVDASKPRV